MAVSDLGRGCDVLLGTERRFRHVSATVGVGGKAEVTPTSESVDFDPKATSFWVSAGISCFGRNNVAG